MKWHPWLALSNRKLSEMNKQFGSISVLFNMVMSQVSLSSSSSSPPATTTTTSGP